MPGVGIWRTKSVEQSIADTDEPETKLKKELTAKDLTVFGVAVVIGAGIFTLTARTAGNVAGPSISLAFVLAAIACGLAALCYAEFASTVPVAGSAYTFSYATFGEFAAWIIGWDLILEFALASAVVGKGWSLYLGNVIGASGSTTAHIGSISFDWGALLIIGAITPDPRDRHQGFLASLRNHHRYQDRSSPARHRRGRVLHQEGELLPLHPAVRRNREFCKRNPSDLVLLADRRRRK